MFLYSLTVALIVCIVLSLDKALRYVHCTDSNLNFLRFSDLSDSSRLMQLSSYSSRLENEAFTWTDHFPIKIQVAIQKKKFSLVKIELVLKFLDGCITSI